MINELRKKSNKELGNLIIQMKAQLLEYRFKAASGSLEKTHQVKLAKKTIAMSYTILRERNVDLIISSTDHALVEYKDGKRIITSINDDTVRKVEPVKKEELKKVVEVKKEEPKEEPKKETKPTPKPKMINGIEVGKKHVEVKTSELAVYNYEKRRTQWRKNAGYNEQPVQCSICKEPKHTSILTDTKKHICYTCFIKKSEFEKNKTVVTGQNTNAHKTNNVTTKSRMIRNQAKG